MGSERAFPEIVIPTPQEPRIGRFCFPSPDDPEPNFSELEHSHGGSTFGTDGKDIIQAKVEWLTGEQPSAAMLSLRCKLFHVDGAKGPGGQ